jgi:prepilin-type N-terminal cleavage/methylation domain-containing protein
MISLKKSNKGFTIVELLIVIVVIGILALLVITTYSGIQAKARNSKRASDVKSLQTHIEAFFSQKGYYPSRADLNLPSWRVLPDNMKGLDANALKDPSSTCDPSPASGSSTCIVAAPVAKAYAYAVLDSAGASCELDDTTCAKYTLTATYEGTVNGKSTAVATNLDGS